MRWKTQGTELISRKNNISKIVELLLTDLEQDEKENGWIPASADVMIWTATNTLRSVKNMRLIDADLLKKNCKCTGKFEDNFKCVSLSDLRRVIGKQPTAFDVDKVVEQLENRSELARPVGWSKAYEIIMLKGAIEIVKEGGTE